MGLGQGLGDLLARLPAHARAIGAGVAAVRPVVRLGQLQHAFVRNFFLGHIERCAEEDVRRFRLSLDDTSEDGGIPAVLREDANV